MQYWLMKSEPEAYSLERLCQEQQTGWDGIRNYQARNLMRDQMQVGDLVLFYHSNAKPPGVAGLATVTQTGLVDPSQFDLDSKYYDPKATVEAPRWIMVEIAYKSHFPTFVALPDLRQQKDLAGLMVIQKGSRLSVQPVSKTHFETICQMGGARV